jgi:hypothetical protein
MVQAQDRNRVNAMNNEISDNLDLRAVADIFGDSRNLRNLKTTKRPRTTDIKFRFKQ